VIASDRGLAALPLPIPRRTGLTGRHAAALARAAYLEDHAGTAACTASSTQTVARGSSRCGVVLIGTDFEVGYGDASQNSEGRAVSYSDIATKISRPKASRAVGAAVARTRCRLVPWPSRTRKSGALTGYHWGITRKQAMLGWEAGASGFPLAGMTVHPSS